MPPGSGLLPSLLLSAIASLSIGYSRPLHDMVEGLRVCQLVSALHYLPLYLAGPAQCRHQGPRYSRSSAAIHSNPPPTRPQCCSGRRI